MSKSSRKQMGGAAAVDSKATLIADIQANLPTQENEAPNETQADFIIVAFKIFVNDVNAASTPDEKIAFAKMISKMVIHDDATCVHVDGTNITVRDGKGKITPYTNKLNDIA